MHYLELEPLPEAGGVVSDDELPPELLLSGEEESLEDEPDLVPEPLLSVLPPVESLDEPVLDPLPG